MSHNPNPLPSLQMKLPTLKDLPPMPTLPEGYSLRLADQTDEVALAFLLGKAFPEIVWTTDRARRDLFEDKTVKEVWIIEFTPSSSSHSLMVSTASARHMERDAPGYVHWVGAEPEHRGKGLGRAITLQVLHRFREWGLDSAVLETDDVRLPAISTYEKLGFIPIYETHASYPERWSKIRTQIEEKLQNRETGQESQP